MSDLISKAEAIEMIMSLDENVVKHSSDMKILAVERIKRLPVAYDKEAVVEWLESEKNMLIGKQIIETDTIKIDRAIEIVKAGGIDG